MTGTLNSHQHDHQNFHNHGYGLGLVAPHPHYHGHGLSHNSNHFDDYRFHLNPNDPIVNGLYNGPIAYDPKYEVHHGPHHGVSNHHAPHDFHGHHADNGSGVHGHSIHDSRHHSGHNYLHPRRSMSNFQIDLATRPSYMNQGPQCSHHYSGISNSFSLDGLKQKYSDLQAKVSYLANATVPWATSCSCFNCKLITKYHY